MTDVIETDRNLYIAQAVNYKEIFSNLQYELTEELEFYSMRRQFYAHFGPHCCIYALIKLFEQKPETVPVYSQILVDEYQDFNKLEIKLIDILAENSPLLLVGDDDRALYSFKYADPDEIRARFGSTEHESFVLPYCSRCPVVIVRAANILIDEGAKRGLLKDRIEKDYRYFSCKEKDEISEQNPKIIIRQSVFETAVAFNIEKDIRNLAVVDDDFSVLIICPLKKQIAALAKALEKKGFGNVQIPLDSAQLTKEEGYRRLLKNDQCNLGWRILAKFALDNAELSDIVKKSIEELTPVKDCLGIGHQNRIVRVLRILKKLRDGRDLSHKESVDLVGEFGFEPLPIAVAKVREEVVLSGVSSAGHKNTTIKIVTMLGAKGLSADYVFIVNSDDRYLLDRKVATDASICRFFVAITRTQKRLIIYSAKKELPTYVQWLSSDFIEIQ